MLISLLALLLNHDFVCVQGLHRAASAMILVCLQLLVVFPSGAFRVVLLK